MFRCGIINDGGKAMSHQGQFNWCVHLKISHTGSKIMCTLSELSGIVIVSSQLWCCSDELELSF